MPRAATAHCRLRQVVVYDPSARRAHVGQLVVVGFFSPIELLWLTAARAPVVAPAVDSKDLFTHITPAFLSMAITRSISCSVNPKMNDRSVITDCELSI